MRVVAPSWLCHGPPNSGIPIFSLDIQNDLAGGRLATAGQDCTVRIWDTKLLEKSLVSPDEVVKNQRYNNSNNNNNDNMNNNNRHNKNDHREAEDGHNHENEEGDNSKNMIGLLGEVKAHAKSVSVVRWGVGGDKLDVVASGGDDCCVVLYEMEKDVHSGGRGFSGGFGVSRGLKEDWRARKSLRGHESDVTDLAWSPCGSKLASASVDNVICVWELWRWGGRLIRRLEGHQGMVKGISWDPMGRFIASQGSDRKVVVWRATDWQKEIVVTEPFKKAVKSLNEKQFFLRLSWSPCGTQLITTNAYNPPKHVAAMLSRESGFTEHIDLAGHSAPVVSTRFSPRLYTRSKRYRSQSQSHPPVSGASANKNLVANGVLNNIPNPTSAVGTANHVGTRPSGTSVANNSTFSNTATNSIDAIDDDNDDDDDDDNDDDDDDDNDNDNDNDNDDDNDNDNDDDNDDDDDDDNDNDNDNDDDNDNNDNDDDPEVTIVEPVNTTPSLVTPKRRRSRPLGLSADEHDGPAQMYTCVAIGSKDTGASIWQAGSLLPFFSLSHMFSQDVIDIAWGSSGLTLAAASTDGTVMYLRFTEAELGKVLTLEDERTVLQNARRNFASGEPGARLIESKVQLEMEARNSRKTEMAKTNPVSKHTQQQPKQQQILPGQGLTGAITQPSLHQYHDQSHYSVPHQGPDSQALLQGQTQRVHSNVGQKQPRRIRPQPAGVSSQAPAPAFTTNMPPPGPAQYPVQETVSGMQAKAQVSPEPSSSSLLPAGRQQMVRTPVVTLANQRETRGKGGKRRIIPQALDSSTSYEPSLSQSAMPPPTKVRRVDGRGSQIGVTPGAEVINVDISMANGFAAPTAVQSVPSVGQAMTNNMVVKGLHHTDVPNGGIGVGSVVGLNSALLDETNVGQRARVIEDGAPPTVIEILRGDGSVVCTKGGKILWREYYENPTQVAGVGGKFVAIATHDGMLGLHSAVTGRRLSPLIVMDSPPHLLTAQIVQDTQNDEELWYLLVISRTALCSVYDIKSLKLTCARSAAMLIAKPVELPSDTDNHKSAPTTNKTSLNEDVQTLTTRVYREISSGQVTPTGEPILLLNDGLSYCYSRSFHSWILVAPRAPLNSEFRRSLLMTEDVTSSCLRTLQARANLIGNNGNNMKLPSGDLRRAGSDSLAHLEILLGAAQTVGSSKDYKYYLALYAARLAIAVEEEIEGIEDRVREVCEMFMGKGKIIGMEKRNLLKDVVLPVLAKNRALQRIVAEFMECLIEIERREKQKWST